MKKHLSIFAFKFQLGMSIVLCLLLFVLAIGQTIIIAPVFHPILLVFYLMAVFSFFYVIIAIGELRQELKKN